MKLHLTTLPTSIKGSSTIIIPILPSLLTDLNDLSQTYQIAGINKIAEILNKRPGQYTTSFLGTDENQTIILFNAEEATQNAINQSCIKILKSNVEHLSKDIIVDLRFIGTSQEIDLTSALLRGIFLSDHTVGMHKTDAGLDLNIIEHITIISHIEDQQIKSIFHRAKAAADTIKSCMMLVNQPANHKSPQDMADWMIKSGQKHDFKVEILDKQELEEQGFHALLSVNRGSEDPARCIIAQYTGGDENAPTIGLVGKGVTFDTGGMSIKPSNNMHYMKSDMGGAAAVMGTIELVAKLKLPVNVFGILPCSDNSVDSLATKPGDVIKSYKGSTIEVIDTDAEGRLVLADGLNYAVRNMNPDYLVDLATLTGSVVRSLGTHAAGLMTNSEKMAETLLQAGNLSGDRLWRLPLWNDYDQYMKSDIADIKNLSDKPMAGAITAGKFLQHFTDGHANWAHLDIAGTAFGPSPFSKGYSASGFGILLLLSWIELISQN